MNLIFKHFSEREIRPRKNMEMCGNAYKLDEDTEGEEGALLLTIFYYYDDEIKGDKMVGACCAHEVDERCVQNFGWKD
jgi:hypothetical protein